MSSNRSFSFLILFSLLLLLILDYADLTASGSCVRECGRINIPYPFGVGQGCYLEKGYEIECVSNTSTSGDFVPFLSVIGKEVVNISLPRQRYYRSSSGRYYRSSSVPHGSVRIKLQITSKGCSSDKEEFETLLNLTGTPFYLTYRNQLIGVGCNNTASLTNIEPNMVGCKSSCNTEDHTPTKDYKALLACHNMYGSSEYCDDIGVMNDTSCNGNRCCKANMPEMIPQIVGVRIDSTTPSTGGCQVAFVTDEAYTVLNGSDPKRFHAKRFATLELGWFIHMAKRSFVESLGCHSIENYRNLTDKEAYKQNCVCDYNSVLSYARCACAMGYQGNPYISGGCQDINECLQVKDADGRLMFHCEAGKTCVNTQGHYKCEYRYNRPLAIGMGSSFGSLLFIGGIYFIYKFIRKQRRLIQKKKFFKRNGGLLLQQQLTSTKGNVEKTIVFSSRELEKATEKFSLNRILGQGGQGTVYKGMLVDGSIVAVKKSKVVDEDQLEEFINEVVILSQINHRNIVKLLGCCLETNVPLLVYEFIPNGNLSEHLHDEFDDNSMFTWEVRLRIAVDIAGALSYLHSSASSPIYHRDVKSTNIMLDEKYRAKVSDFGTSRTVTVDHTHLTTVVSGTVGYMDPEYFQSSQFTDKSDVYSFGVVLVELITGEKSISFLRSLENRTLATYFISAMKENKLLDIIDGRIRDSCKLNQVTAAAKIARKCLYLKGKNRPSMREVSMELEKIRSSSGDMQPQEYVSENEDEEDTRAIETNMGMESWNNESVTAPSCQYNLATTSSSSLDIEIEPLFPLQTR